MSTPDTDQEKARHEEELKIQRQIAFASGIFQGDVTVRTLLESLAEGVVIIDSSGTILLVNARAGQMFGYPEKELVGKPHAILIPERFRTVHEEHEAHYFAEPRIRPMGQLLDLFGLRRDGSEFPLEISLGYIETINGVLVMALVSDMTLRKQFEMRLRESEELFHIQVEGVKDYAIFMLDTAGNVLNWNAGAERLKGYKENEIIGEHFSCFYPEEERNAGKAEEVLKKAAAEGRVEDKGWQVRKDGSRFWADVIITALYNESGNLRRFSKVTRDITERKKSEEALRFSEARYRALFESVPDPCLVLDPILKIVDVNGAYLAATMTKQDEIMGRGIFEVFPDNPADPNATGVRNLSASLNRVLTNRAPDTMAVQKYDIRKPEEEGGAFEERYWSPINTPVFGEENEIAYIIHRVEDVTEFVHIKQKGIEEHRLTEEMRERAVQMEAEIYARVQDVAESNLKLKRANEELEMQREKLMESEQRFVSFMSHLPAAAWIKDLHGRYVYANAEAERIFSRRFSELAGKTDEETFPLDIARLFVKNDRRVLAEGGSLQTTEVLLQADGIEHHSIVNKFAMAGSDGQPAYIAGVALDITERKRTEEALRFSEARYRALHRDNPTMIVTLDTDFTILSVNPFCAGQLGYTTDELEGQSVLKLFHADDHPIVSEQLWNCLQHPDQVYRWQLRKVRNDGELLWVEETAQAVHDLNGMRNVLVVCQDITDRKRLENEREQLLIQLEAVLENINEGVAISDLDGNILTMNKEALALHDYESVEQVHRPLSEYQDTFELSYLDGGPVPFEEWPLIRALRNERFVDYEVLVLRKDTGRSWVGSYSGAPVRSKSGDIILLVLTMRDITERKRTEAEIQRLASFPLMNPNPVIELDADGKLTFCNLAAKKILEDAGYSCSSNPLIPEDLPVILQALREEKAEQITREVEVGGYFFGELIMVLPQSQAVRIYTMNISERKRAEEEIKRLNTDLAARAADLEAANVELEAFNYSVAHDLRNPLNVISMNCQVIQELCGDKLNEQCMGHLQETYNGTIRMNRLIGALLEFSRMAHAELNLDKVDLSSIAGEVAVELKRTETARRIEVRIPDGIWANGDAGLLRMALTNLLGNAWKYTAMQEEAIIEFGAKERDGQPVYFLRDNGAGFDMAYAEKIFAPFQRLPGAEEYRGFGIGLATVERIIRRHGGRIWAEGEPGKGATFFFTSRS